MCKLEVKTEENVGNVYTYDNMEQSDKDKLIDLKNKVRHSDTCSRVLSALYAGAQVKLVMTNGTQLSLDRWVDKEDLLDQVEKELHQTDESILSVLK